MKHHFGDFLDRDGDYWTIVPNRERYSYRIGEVADGDERARIMTVGKDDGEWERIFTLPNLEELTLHEPSHEQMESLRNLVRLNRRRVTHARPKSIESLSSLINVEELVLEYVSGFSDLSPLRELPKLRALHCENLRRVSDWSGLVGVKRLRYLSIHGTLDWKQPIADFEFLRGLPGLEVLHFFQVINKSSYPAFLPAVHLKRLKKISIAPNIFAAEEYALLEVALKGVEGAAWEPCQRWPYRQLPLPKDDVRSRLSDDEIRANHPEVLIRFDGKREISDPDSEWFEFVGKEAGRVKCTSPSAEKKCAEYEAKYSQMKDKAQTVLSNA